MTSKLPKPSNYQAVEIPYFIRLAQRIGPIYFVLEPKSNISPKEAGFSITEVEETRRKYMKGLVG